MRIDMKIREHQDDLDNVQVEIENGRNLDPDSEFYGAMLTPNEMIARENWAKELGESIDVSVVNTQQEL